MSFILRPLLSTANYGLVIVVEASQIKVNDHAGSAQR